MLEVLTVLAFDIVSSNQKHQKTLVFKLALHSYSVNINTRV